MAKMTLEGIEYEVFFVLTEAYEHWEWEGCSARVRESKETSTEEVKEGIIEISNGQKFLVSVKELLD